MQPERAPEADTSPTRPPVSSPSVAAKRLVALVIGLLYRPLRSTARMQPNMPGMFVVMQHEAWQKRGCSSSGSGGTTQSSFKSGGSGGPACGEAVEQVLPGGAHVGEPDGAVVDAVEAHLRRRGRGGPCSGQATRWMRPPTAGPAAQGPQPFGTAWIHKKTSMPSPPCTRSRGFPRPATACPPRRAAAPQRRDCAGGQEEGVCMHV